MVASINGRPDGRALRAVDPHLVSLLKPRSFEAEQYRRLRQRIEDLQSVRQHRVIAVTSPVAHEGKSLTAINLAVAFAQSPTSRVLLIDSDMRQPRVAQMLGLDKYTNGWPGLLENGGDIHQATRSVAGAPAGLAVLCASRSRANTYDLLRSARVAEVLDQARRLYDFVIIDTPPTIPVPDSGLLARVVDGYIVVVGANTTPRKLLEETLNLLPEQAIIGLVFNRDTRPLFGYYQTHYQKYFESYARSVSRGL